MGEPHYHRWRCVGCHFSIDDQECTCDEPHDHDYVCYECDGSQPVKDWQKLQKENARYETAIMKARQTLKLQNRCD